MITVVLLARDKFSTLPTVCSSLAKYLDQNDHIIICDSGYPNEIIEKAKNSIAAHSCTSEILSVGRFAGVNHAWNKAVQNRDIHVALQIENDAVVDENVISNAKKFYRSGGHGVYVPIVFERDQKTVHFWPISATIKSDEESTEFHLDRGRSDTPSSQRCQGIIDLFERHCFFIDAQSLHKLGSLDEHMICRTDIDISIQAKQHDIPITLDPKSTVTFYNHYDMSVDHEFADHRWSISRVASSHSRLLNKWNIVGYKRTITHAFSIREKLFGEKSHPKTIDELGY